MQSQAPETTESMTSVASRPTPAAADRNGRVTRRERQMVWQLGTFSWLAVDASIAVLSVMLAFIVSPYVGILDTSRTQPGYVNFAIAVAISICMVAHIAGLHDSRLPRIILDLVGRVCLVVGISMMFLNLLLLVMYYEKLSRYMSGFVCVFATLGMIGFRVLVWKLSDTFVQRVCFLGDDRFRFDAVNFVARNRLPFKTVSTLDFPDPGREQPLSDWAIGNDVSEIVYDEASCGQDEVELLHCLDEGLRVTSYADFIEGNYLLVPIERIDARWLLGASVEVAHPYYNGIKRLVDVVVALVGLVLSSPILLLAIVLIKLESPGKAIYSQERVGRFKRPFRIFKLRSMVTNAEANGAQWAAKADARITRVGRILRATRIDEIPQFWNVLRGEMSLVGPRPERPEFVELLSREIPFYLQRHLVKPGLTGWAQINFPYGASVEDAANKLKYDLYYVKHASLMLDLQIALRTLGTVMSGSR